jgi:hypothetical protein
MYRYGAKHVITARPSAHLILAALTIGGLVREFGTVDWHRGATLF